MRMLWFLLKLLALLALALWIAKQPGQLQLSFGEKVIQTSSAVAAFIVLGGLLAFMTAYRGWRWLIDGWKRWRLGNKLRKLEKGQTELSWALTALAGGDADEALRAAGRARKKLGYTPIAGFMQAQAALAVGDQATAKLSYQQLARSEQGAIIGYRGLMTLAMRAGDWHEVERLADQVRREKIEMPWLSTVHYQLAVRKADWAEAYRALSYALSANQLPEAAYHIQQLTLLLAQADVSERQGRDRAAREYAAEAYRLAPDWVPGQLAHIDQQLKAGHARATGKLIEKIWRTAPHPQLADLYRQVHHDEAPLAYYQRLTKSLLTDIVENPVAARALAAAAMSADLWGEARRHLMFLVNAHQATAADFQALARLERRETGNETSASQWLSQAARAQPAPAWVCTACNKRHHHWQHNCPACGAFATLEWSISGADKEAHPIIQGVNTRQSAPPELTSDLRLWDGGN